MTRACHSELVLRAHRGPVTAAEHLALEAHLTTCQTCRQDQAILSAFASDDAVDVHDGTRLSQLTTMARVWASSQPQAARTAQRTSRRAGLRGWAATALVLLLAGSASAGAWLWHRHVAPAPTPRTSTPSAISVPRGAAPSTLPALAVAPTPSASPPVVDSERPPRARIDTPADLLRRAGEARRAGDDSRALALYRRLARDFPRSSEALVSAVPFATLLSDGGFPRAALTEFDRYLASSRGGALIPEALFGRARALAKLGDRPEEGRTWQRLLDDFPASAYAAVARRRLAESR